MFPRRIFLKLILFLGMFEFQWFKPFKAHAAPSGRKEESMMLPRPDHEGNLLVEDAIKRRRTVRSFSSSSMRIEDLSQIFYAAQGITDDRSFKRAAPSGGALYPIDVYAVVGKNGIIGLDAGIYHYISSGHRMEHVAKGDKSEQLADSALQQKWMAQPPVNFVITAEYSRICSKYGERGIRYAMIEAGHVGQNIFLQAEALGLKAGIVGAFEDIKVIDILGIPKQHEPLLLMPVGCGA
jgi:SagB-type dehydrogenase family enzyme